MTQYPHDAVDALRDDPTVETRHRRVEIQPAGWPDDPDDGWVGAGALVFDPNERRLALVENHWEEDGWVVPGGGVEPSDTSLAAAAEREIHEETGLTASVDRPLLVEELTFVHAATPERAFGGWYVLFRAVATGTDFTDDPGEYPGEIHAVRWFDRAPDRLVHYEPEIRSALGD